MHKNSLTRLAAAVSVASGLALVVAGVPAQASTGVVPPPTASQPGALPLSAAASQLNAVSALSPSDVWAVGSFDNDAGHGPRIRHWNGHSWRVVPNAGGAGLGSLSGVSAESANDVWTVGEDSNFVNSIIEHWDGHTWTHVANPNPGSGVFLWSVDADSPTDAWAVGTYSAQSQSLIEHWDGTSWTQSVSDDPGISSNVLNSVHAVSPTNVWAVGTYTDDEGVIRTMIQHYDGTGWQRVASPNPGGDNGTFLTGVSGTSASDVWAVGSYGTGTTELSLSEHWDGTIWTQVPTPVIGPKFTTLASVSAVSPSVAFATGSYNHKSVIEQWDGTSWTQMAHPNPGHLRNTGLMSVSADSATDAWAVGTFSFATKSLTEHWDGTAWTVAS